MTRRTSPPAASEAERPFRSQRARVKETPRTAEVERLNETHALIIVGGHAVVLREITTPDGQPDLQFLSVDAFKEWHRPNRIEVGVGKDGEPKYSSLANVWLNSVERRQYLGLTFSPDSKDDSFYNLWRGFAVEPKHGAFPLFQSHILENVCRGDVHLFDWVMGWFAQLVQQPTVKPGTALVLRGKQGTGKSKVGEVFGSLFGPHYLSASSPHRLTGRFNAHLASCLLLHAEEAFWSGDHQAESQIRDLITSSHHLIEHKGREPFRVRNLTRLFVTGNADWIIPAAFEERRFAVLDMSDDRRQDHDYFAAIDREMAGGGREALLHYLLNFDLSQVDLRRIPITEALNEQKLRSMRPEEKWWHGRLQAGCLLPEHDGEWSTEVSADRLFESYVAHAAKTNIKTRAAEIELGLMLRDFVPGISRSRRRFAEPDGFSGMKSVRAYVYILPPLPQCRAAWEGRLGTTIDWSEDDPP